MRRALLLSLVVPLLLHSAPVLAAGDATAQAKARFAAGAQAYREARYKDAIDLFMQANALEPHAELIFNVGQAYEKLGDVPNALRAYRDYLHQKPGASDRATVETSIRNLEARLRERGVQQVSVYSTPAGSTLLLDGKIVGQTPWTGEIAPGRHLAVFRATGYPDVAKEFILLADRAMDLDVALSVAAGGSAAVALAGRVEDPRARDVAPPPPADAPKRSVSPWTFAAFGVGVAGLGAALGLEMARRGAENDAKADPTQLGYRHALDAMSTFQSASRAMVAVGAVATAAGAVFLVIDLRRPGAAPAPAKAGLGCFMGACGAVASGRF